MSENINEILETKSESNQKVSEGGFFSFQKMISVTLIKILYVIGIIIITIVAIGMIVQGAGAHGYVRGEAPGWVPMALIIFGNILWRIICEGWIIIFSLHETTVSILNELKRK